ncbi:uncharacterized protein CC84DRAFT_1146036 [Paraphaeosphaeria sporulosa]|uniref:FAD-binding PCMH-type domain-containing protein n=1 Tax=Paraphaeosphaeria sporulosa TaxID=1460663 RepID=A0A177CEV6_9PLEO|nr:uncharacterized protein CC84DRAFT_1146036 [Paraphaeosphaeria sporulosa]OAG06155.1 hypothetical protein CC84DRAFT_1146036 [Paraphaeosphaeria sporulosa]
MATLDHLKQTLRIQMNKSVFLEQQPLSEQQYSDGFQVLLQASKVSYQEFITPQLNQLLRFLVDSQSPVSILEVGPGPSSVLGHLPGRLRRKIGKYVAFEPNSSFAKRLNESLCSKIPTEPILPSLEHPVVIHQCPFSIPDNMGLDHNACFRNARNNYDLILFCHSMYGMQSKEKVIEYALGMIKDRPQKGMVVVFHRSGSLHFRRLVCNRISIFSTGVVRVADNDEDLNKFALFIAGFQTEDKDIGSAIWADWRHACRTLGHREEGSPNYLLFNAPEVMIVFTRDATSLPELTAQVPTADSSTTIKNWMARSHRPASVVRPTDIQQVQQCVRWALKHDFSLTIIGGGHSSHCLWPTVVSIDMCAFDQIHIVAKGEDRGAGYDAGPFVVVEAGCKTGDIVRKTMAAGITIPLGARPSVGAGLWLQGGIGHLARRYGLACDAIVGAVIVSVQSGQVLYVGHVPSRHRPTDAVLPDCGHDLLWAMRGAGTNFGIVISVTFKTYTALNHVVRNWILPSTGVKELRSRISDFDKLIAKKLQRNSSADGYLYRDAGQLQFGMTMIENYITEPTSATPLPTTGDSIWGPEDNLQVVNGVDLFQTELYVSTLHGGHGNGKTSSFKRCVFLKDIGGPRLSYLLAAAMETCPTSLCYLHLLHGGGAVGDVAADATAFGSRAWEFACVVTGVWQRDLDHTQVAQNSVQWVYDVANKLLPFSCGAYGADLGSDRRDVALAAKAFGPNLPRLTHLKRSLDPCNVLAYTCPISTARMEQKIIIMVTGESGSGKDFCAKVWHTVMGCSHMSLTARIVSISDVTKKEYAKDTGTDLDLLLNDRAYKEHHRSEMTSFFQRQVQERPSLLKEHFLKVVHSEADADVLLITGMRDEAPVAAFSHLVPDRRLLEVYVQASEKICQVRRGYPSGITANGCIDGQRDSSLKSLDYSPSFIFNNETTGQEAAKSFARDHLLPFLNDDLQQLAGMVRSQPDFPHQGTNFRHVLGIPQQPSGLALCTSLLRTHFAGDWAEIDVVVCCEAGGFIYASPLASQIHIPLVPIRKAGKLPPPTVSVNTTRSYISSLATDPQEEERIEIERDAIPKGASVAVVDDVLSSGKTLCAVLQLLEKVGVARDDVSVVVVAELPVHGGRQLIREHGYGRVNIRSLLVFDGV